MVEDSLDTVGERLEANALPQLTHVRDLEWYDGPLLSEFVGPDNEPWLYYWIDVSTPCNRWLICRTTKEDIATYEKESSVRALVKMLDKASKLGPSYVADIDDEVNVRGLWRLPDHSKLDPSYLPSPE